MVSVMAVRRERAAKHPFDRELWKMEMVIGWIEVTTSRPAPTLEEAREVVRRCARAHTRVFQEIGLAAGTTDGTVWLWESCQELIDACAVGQLAAYVPTGQLPAHRWVSATIFPRRYRGAKNVEWLFLSSLKSDDGCDVEDFEEIVFRSSEVRSAFPLPEPQKPSGTGAAEKKCKQWLIEMMKGNGGRQKKDDILKTANEKFARLSRNGFDRAWASACEETGSGWNQSGRPKKTCIKIMAPK